MYTQLPADGPGVNTSGGTPAGIVDWAGVAFASPYAGRYGVVEEEGTEKACPVGVERGGGARSELALEPTTAVICTAVPSPETNPDWSP